MKKGWERKRLGEVCQIRGGGTPSKAIARYWQGSIPWVSPKDMKSEVITDSSDHISPEAVESSATSLIPKESVLVVVRSGILARTVPIALAGCDLTINQDLKALSPPPSVVPKFLFYMLRAKMDELLAQVSRGATVHRLMSDHLRSVDFLLPPLPEQKRIVGILDEAFAAIATAQANAEKNLQNARDLFESHLNAVFSQRGPGWVEKTIGEEVELLTGFPFKSTDYTESEEDVRLLRGDNIAQGALRWDDVKRWPVSDAAEYESYRLSGGDVVLAMDRPWVKAGLKRAQVSAADLPCLLVQRTARLRSGINVQDRFLFYLVSSDAFTRHILGVQGGSGVPHISGQQIKDFKFRRPPLSEQAGIVRQLGEIEAASQHLSSLYRRKLASLSSLKKSLLHQAFNGEL